uniref:Uncharacterized protein n=1 Tax=Arundo donax TaxID=35708 RepID=A0A0A8Y125_ARUDO
MTSFNVLVRYTVDILVKFLIETLNFHNLNWLTLAYHVSHYFKYLFARFAIFSFFGLRNL